MRRPKLLLHFMVMGSWRTTVPCFAAGMALFTDSASPTFEADQVIQDWLTLSAEALETARESDRSPSTLEAAEIFLVPNLGATFFGRHVRLNMPGTQKLRFVRAGLTAAGVSHVDQHADDVLGKHDGRLPTFDYSRINDYSSPAPLISRCAAHGPATSVAHREAPLALPTRVPFVLPTDLD